MTAATALVAAAHDALAQADQVLITAGAGLSAAAGYDYADREDFERIFPELTKTGFGSRLDFINPGLPDTFLWGFWAKHLTNIRFDPAGNDLYLDLADLVAGQDHFVMTSNVDALFERNGFAADRIFTPQGDYGYYQCFTPCTRTVWDSRPIVADLLPLIDPETGAVPEAAVPTCPNCGGRTFLNVNIGRPYVNDHFLPNLDRLNEWLTATVEGSLVVLEFGAGFNTPGVIRVPGERIVARHPDAHLIRVNPTQAQVPDQLGSRAQGLAVDAREFLAQRPAAT